MEVLGFKYIVLKRSFCIWRDKDKHLTSEPPDLPCLASATLSLGKYLRDPLEDLAASKATGYSGVQLLNLYKLLGS